MVKNEEILKAIRSLKREITRLKNIAEHPEYVCEMHPSESVRISCSQDYLERAKLALKESGVEYQPTKSELKAIEFDANIPNISKIIFSIDGFLRGGGFVHVGIHSWRDHDGFSHSSKGGGERIISDAVSHLAEHIRRGRGYDHQVRPIWQRDMLGAMLVDSGKHIGIDLMTANSLQCKRSDKLQGMLGSCHLHICACFLK